MANWLMHQAERAALVNKYTTEIGKKSAKLNIFKDWSKDLFGQLHFDPDDIVFIYFTKASPGQVYVTNDLAHVNGAQWDELVYHVASDTIRNPAYQRPQGNRQFVWRRHIQTFDPLAGHTYDFTIHGGAATMATIFYVNGGGVPGTFTQSLMKLLGKGYTLTVF